MWENKKVFKRISLLLVLTIFIGFGLPINEIAIAVEINQYEKSAKENHIKQKEKNKAKTEIGKFEEDLNKHYEKVKESTKKEDLKSLKENIKGLKEALKIKKAEVIEELNKNEQTIKKLKIPSAQKRHEEFKKEIDKKLLDFEELLKEVDNISNTLKEAKGKGYEELKEKIKEIETIVTPEQSEEPIGNSLPHKNVQADSPEPRVNKGITPLYMNNNIQSNSSEDLEETIETKANEEIKDLADSLETPIEMYEYILNNITFEPYYGSRKGAIGTFEQNSGNDIDQASLLISMLRHNKIPSRYVKGTVEITAEEAMGWTGAETPQAAANILATSGRPVTGITSGGKITAVRLEKVWVEACIPYENYRGIGKNEGQKIWVPLDPSFKQYEKIEGIDIKEIFEENVSNIVSEEFEQLIEAPSVSAIKVLDEANKMGIPIYTITKNNISNILPKLEVNQTVKDKITNAVREGRIVTIPVPAIASYAIYKFIKYEFRDGKVNMKEGFIPFLEEHCYIEKIVTEFLNKSGLTILDKTLLSIEIPNKTMEMRKSNVTIYHYLFEDEY